jgi:tetratricopeptide (TPR) repeat protein
VVVGEIPQEPPAFQDRPDLLSGLTSPAAESRVRVVFAVTGLRGVGKSQLAAACARQRLAEGWPVVAWLDASLREQLLGGYAQLAAALGLAGDSPDSAEAALRVRHWLEADGEKCLLVLDNADSADVLRPFLPAAGRAQVIVTSSRASLAALGAPVPVGVFTDLEAVAFLAERTGLADTPGALEVAAELGSLPLALAQAAVVIAGQHLDYPTYLERLVAVPVAQYLTRPEEDPYPRGTAEAITLALDAAQKTDSADLGTQLLDIIALLSPVGTSRTLLADAADGDPAKVDAALQHLAAWSLVTWSVDGATVTAHRLVMRVAREQAAAGQTLAAVAQRASRALHAMLPAADDAWRHPVLMQEFVQQVTALSRHLDALSGPLDRQVEKDLLPLLAWAGWYLNEISDISRAIPILERVRADSERIFGADHRETLRYRNNLASAYESAGRLDEAIVLLEQTVADNERVLGPDHPSTFTLRSNLASGYESAGRVGEAIVLHEQTVADSLRVLGPDHPHTMAYRDNLASAYESAGRLDEAIELHEQTLTNRERGLGIDHPSTLASRNNLAYAYESAGRVGEAIVLHEQTVADSERVLGPDHPDTLTFRNNLAGVYASAGRLDEAISQHEQTLTNRERILGPDHPHTLISRGNLAGVYASAGRLDEAISLHEQAVTDRERILGPDHPETLGSRNNLAHAYASAGRLDEAMRLYEQTLADAERVLGSDHPDTLISCTNLADAYASAGRRDDAIRLYEQTLAHCERGLGATHPLTKALRRKLQKSQVSSKGQWRSKR